LSPTNSSPSSRVEPLDSFVRRHVGPDEVEVRAMLEAIGASSLDQLIDETLPADIRVTRPLDLGPALSERELITRLRGIAQRNRVQRNFLGMGYSGCIVPPVIQRNVLENPCWYTQYTPYQAEIAQGRLEALLTFQTMVSDLCGLPMANASMLDEATAAAEALAMCRAALRNRPGRFLVSGDCHPQTIAVVRTRAEALGVEVFVGNLESAEFGDCLGALVQYPTSDGRVQDHAGLAERVHAAGGMLVVATDLLALTLLRPPGEFGADVAVGSTQRFGVPMGFGGPHAAFLATREEHRRLMPGRIIGLSRDARGMPALRMALQTREQHIRRDKATSNICTAQVLLAVMAAMYAVWHGPDGLRAIARQVHRRTLWLAAGLRALGLEVGAGPVFDTLSVGGGGRSAKILAAAAAAGMNLRKLGADRIGISLDETTTEQDVDDLLAAFAGEGTEAPRLADLAAGVQTDYEPLHARRSSFMEHPVFHDHRTEHEMLRFLTRLQSRDLSLAHSMIPLGSCTMKLNATTEMVPVTWPEFAHIHPFAPADQTAGYRELIEDLERQL
jgi:glycine dehydrogenase